MNNAFPGRFHWINYHVFQAETLPPASMDVPDDFPQMLREARQMEKKESWASRQLVFYRQAQFLAEYEDDYPYDGDPVRYFPTYSSFTSSELRGYFSWRSRFRAGKIGPAPLSFIFLHTYELINAVGVQNPQEGHERLLELLKAYGPGSDRVAEFLNDWIRDYIIYYNLDGSLLPPSHWHACNRNIEIVEKSMDNDPQAAMEGVRHLALAWLGRSKFYALYPAEMDKAIIRILREMRMHYRKSCKRSLMEQFFGRCLSHRISLFSSAIFCDPLKRKDYSYKINRNCTYICKAGQWSVTGYNVTLNARRKFEKLIKAIDCIMREEFQFGYPIKREISLKWLLELIRSEARQSYVESRIPKKREFYIDIGRLDKIRVESRIICDKLIQEELDLQPEIEDAPTMVRPSDMACAADSITSLDDAESRLLRCLLYGNDLDWLKEEGLMFSVLVDGINEKAYEIFEDSVIDGEGKIVEDYYERLKELFPL